MSRTALALALITTLAPAAALAAGEDRIAPRYPRIDAVELRAKLVEVRRANLAAFRAYRLAAVYPSNVFTTTPGNIWRDQDGHYCAAATIIRASGDTQLVERIAEDNNFFRIAEVEQGPVMDWILTSGFTQAELVLIQRPFRPVTQTPALEPTTKLAIDPRLRAAETRRLTTRYRTIEHELVKQQRASLDLAVARLLERPDLARRLLGGA